MDKTKLVERMKKSFQRYGGKRTLILWSLLLVALIAAFVIHVWSVTAENPVLFTSTSEETRAIIAGLLPWYYSIFNIIGFALGLAFVITFLVGFILGFETLLSVGFVGFGFTIAFVAFRTTLISVGGSVYPGIQAIGEYAMGIFMIAGIYNFIVAMTTSHFIEDFRRTVLSLVLGCAFIFLFDFIGAIDYFKRGYPILSLSVVFEMAVVFLWSWLAYRTIHAAEKLMD
jgi:hypothetical protein